MPVLESDLKLYGSLYMPRNDTDINGGAIDITNEITGVLGEVFNDLESDEAGGVTYYQYRKVFFKNTSTTSNLENAKIWILSDPENQVTIALEPTKNGNDQSANRITAPVGYTFVEAQDEDNALTLPGNGHLENGEAIGVWLKLTLAAGLPPKNQVDLKLKIKGASTE
jgi:hypothetical protein